MWSEWVLGEPGKSGGPISIWYVESGVGWELQGAEIDREGRGRVLEALSSDAVRPHRRQPTRLLCPWDSPGKNTGVGCHFLLQCMKVKSESVELGVEPAGLSG